MWNLCDISELVSLAMNKNAVKAIAAYAFFYKLNFFFIGLLAWFARGKRGQLMKSIFFSGSIGSRRLRYYGMVFYSLTSRNPTLSSFSKLAIGLASDGVEKPPTKTW